jgi:hypothetical protein
MQENSQVAIPPSDEERAASRRKLSKLKVVERFALMFGAASMKDGELVWSKGPTPPLRAAGKEVEADPQTSSFFYTSSVVELYPRLEAMQEFILGRLLQEFEFHLRTQGSIHLGPPENPDSLTLINVPSGPAVKQVIGGNSCLHPVAEMPLRSLVDLMNRVHEITRFNQMGLDPPSDAGKYQVSLSNGTLVEAHYCPDTSKWFRDENGHPGEQVGALTTLYGKSATLFSRIC